jgi:predicted ribosome quality control (RQC) complex YloA/Tae2 family protein
MLSLKELQRAAGILAGRLSGCRLQRVVQPDAFRLAMELYRPPAAIVLLLSSHPRFARVSLLAEMPKAATAPPAFIQYLKAHSDHASFEGVNASPHDRSIGIRLGSRTGALEIVLSILGPRSNIYLLNQQRVLLSALRPLAQTRRALAFGQPWVDPEGSPRTEGADRWECVPDDRFLDAIEETYKVQERKEEAEILARRIEGVLHKETEFLERKAANLLQDLGEAIQAEKYRHRGELLKQVLHTIRPGAESVAVTDCETGAQTEITLDPRLAPAENLAAYFKRYQKELRGTRVLEEQLRILRTVQDEIAGFQDRLAPLPDLEALRTLAAEPRLHRLLTRQYPDRKPRPIGGKKEIPNRLRPKRYKTDQGLEIWVGRNDEGNDYLSTRLAHGNDLFFHLEGYPGSHVILRTGGNTSPPSESVLAACELAVHFSKLKDVRKADVHFAPVKNLRKPKGAKPGLVYISGGRSIHLRRDPKRLENILAARIEE